VINQTTTGGYALWFVLLLTLGKIAASSLSIGIGGSASLALGRATEDEVKAGRMTIDQATHAMH
jgi:hypothetical protein